MNVHEWHFRLDGDQFDIKGIAELFTHEVKIIKDYRREEVAARTQ